MASQIPTATAGATTVSTVSTLATKKRSDFASDTIHMLGYTASGDLGAGMLEYIGTASPTANELNVTHFADSESKYWRRQRGIPLTPHHAGYTLYESEHSSSDCAAILGKLNALRELNHNIRGYPNAHYYCASGITVNRSEKGNWDFDQSVTLFPDDGTTTGITWTLGTGDVRGPVHFGDIYKLNWSTSPEWLNDAIVPDTFDQTTPIGAQLKNVTDIGIKCDGGNKMDFTFGSIRGFHIATALKPNTTYIGRTFFTGRNTRNCRFETVLMGKNTTSWLNNVRWSIEESQISSSITDMGGKDAVQCWIGIEDPTAYDPTNGYAPNLNSMEFGSFEIAAGNYGKLVHIFLERARDCDFEFRVDSNAYYSALIIDHENDATYTGSGHHDWMKNANKNTIRPQRNVGVIRGNGNYNPIEFNNNEPDVTAEYEVTKLGRKITASGTNDYTSTEFDFHNPGTATSTLRQTTLKNYQVWQLPDRKDALRTSGLTNGIGVWAEWDADTTRRGYFELSIRGEGFRYGLTTMNSSGTIVKRGDAALDGRAVCNADNNLNWGYSSSYDMEYLPLNYDSNVFRFGFNEAIRKMFVHIWTHDTTNGWLESFKLRAIEIPGCKIYALSPDYRFVESEPKHGIWNRADHIRLDDGTANATNGYYVDSNGERYAQSQAWASGMTVTRGQWVKTTGSGDEIHEVTSSSPTTAGTDTPTGATFTDNAGVTWRRIAQSITADATFEAY